MSIFMAKFDENVAAKYIAKISILNFFTKKTNVNKGQKRFFFNFASYPRIHSL